MRKLLIIILIISRTLFLHAGNTVDSVLAFADAQYLKGNYRLALKEYQRISFHTDYSDPYFQLRLANCYSRIGEWEIARNYYDQVFNLAAGDSLLVEAKIRKISGLIRENEYNLALIDLFGLPDTTYRKYHREFNLLFGICYFGLEDFDEAKRYFKVVVAESIQAQEEIEKIFSDKKLLKRPKPGFAYALSVVLPGLGQIYSGDIKDGLNSFFLTESLIILAVFVAYEYTLIDAIVSVLPWYQRYYLGGLNHAKEAAILQRKRNRSEVYRRTLDVIMEYQKK